MKIGMNLLLWGAHIKPEHYPTIEKIKRSGFDGVEIPIFEGDENHFRSLGEHLRNQGLGCTAVTVMPRSSASGASAPPPPFSRPGNRRRGR